MDLIQQVLKTDEEATNFLKLTKQFKKGNMQADEFVNSVEEKLGEPVATQVLPLMAQMLATKPEIQKSLTEHLEDLEEGARYLRRALGTFGSYGGR